MDYTLTGRTGTNPDYYYTFKTVGILAAPKIEIIGTEKNGWYPVGTKVRVYDPTPESETTVANMSYGLHGSLTTNLTSRDFTIDITESGEYNFIAASYDSTGKESEKTYKTFKADVESPQIKISGTKLSTDRKFFQVYLEVEDFSGVEEVRVLYPNGRWDNPVVSFSGSDCLVEFNNYEFENKVWGVSNYRGPSLPECSIDRQGWKQQYSIRMRFRLLLLEY